MSGTKSTKPSEDMPPKRTTNVSLILAAIKLSSSQLERNQEALLSQKNQKLQELDSEEDNIETKLMYSTSNLDDIKDENAQSIELKDTLDNIDRKLRAIEYAQRAQPYIESFQDHTNIPASLKQVAALKKVLEDKLNLLIHDPRTDETVDIELNTTKDELNGVNARISSLLGITKKSYAAFSKKERENLFEGKKADYNAALNEKAKNRIIATSRELSNEDTFKLKWGFRNPDPEAFDKIGLLDWQQVFEIADSQLEKNDQQKNMLIDLKAKCGVYIELKKELEGYTSATSQISFPLLEALYTIYNISANDKKRFDKIRRKLVNNKDKALTAIDEYYSDLIKKDVMNIPSSNASSIVLDSENNPLIMHIARAEIDYHEVCNRISKNALEELSKNENIVTKDKVKLFDGDEIFLRYHQLSKEEKERLFKEECLKSFNNIEIRKILLTLKQEREQGYIDALEKSEYIQKSQNSDKVLAQKQWDVLQANTALNKASAEYYLSRPIKFMSWVYAFSQLVILGFICTIILLAFSGTAVTAGAIAWWVIGGAIILWWIQATYRANWDIFRDLLVTVTFTLWNLLTSPDFSTKGNRIKVGIAFVISVTSGFAAYYIFPISVAKIITVLFGSGAFVGISATASIPFAILTGIAIFLLFFYFALKAALNNNFYQDCLDFYHALLMPETENDITSLQNKLFENLSKRQHHIKTKEEIQTQLDSSYLGIILKTNLRDYKEGNHSRIYWRNTAMLVLSILFVPLVLIGVTFAQIAIQRDFTELLFESFDMGFKAADTISWAVCGLAGAGYAPLFVPATLQVIGEYVYDAKRTADGVDTNDTSTPAQRADHKQVFIGNASDNGVQSFYGALDAAIAQGVSFADGIKDLAVSTWCYAFGAGLTAAAASYATASIPGKPKMYDNILDDSKNKYQVAQEELVTHSSFTVSSTASSNTSSTLLADWKTTPSTPGANKNTGEYHRNKFYSKLSQQKL